MSPAPWLRHSFELKSQPAAASLSITALGLYCCELNGAPVGERIFAPGWTDYRVRVQFQTYDVTSQLRSGENTLGVVLGDGWYVGYVAWWSRQNGGDRPSLLLQLDLDFPDGSKQSISSGPDWKVSDGPILESDFLMGETYDARRELSGWSEPAYDDSDWRPVVVLPSPQIAISPSLDPGVARQEILKPVSEKLAADGKTRHFDFGQNFAGRVRLKVRSRSGTTLKIRHSEILNSDGTPYYDNLRSARATDHYTCRGNEKETWEPRFTFHGFRYAEVSGLSAEDDFEIEGIVLHSEMQRTGNFSCSNSLLNRLFENIVWGQKSNFLEAPTDCPQRDERLGWTGDAQVFIRTACFTHQVQSFFHKWLRDVRDAQTAQGAVPPVIPSVQSLLNDPDGGPGWSDAIVICPWTIYLCYGDLDVLRDNYEAMKRYVHYHATERSLNGIRYHPDLPGFPGFGDWLALDGSGKVGGGTPKDLIGTAFLAHDLEILHRVALILKKTDDATEFHRLREACLAAFQRRFVTPDGHLVGATQTSYVLALHFDLVSHEVRNCTAAELARKIREDGYQLGTGFLGTPYLLDVLEATGHLDLAYRLLEREEFPSWLFPVTCGATTIWERWDGWTSERGFQDKAMNSFNHYAYGAVGAWMVRTVAGLEIDPEAPGYARVVFRPKPGENLTWAEASMVTRFGLVRIRWETRNALLHVDITVPEGVEACFETPAGFVPYDRPISSGERLTFELKPLPA